MSMCEEEPIKPWKQKVVRKEVFTLHRPIFMGNSMEFTILKHVWWTSLLFIDEPYPTSTDLQHVKHVCLKRQKFHNPYCWWKKCCTTCNVQNPVNNAYQLVSRISSINSMNPRFASAATPLFFGWPSKPFKTHRLCFAKVYLGDLSNVFRAAYDSMSGDGRAVLAFSTEAPPRSGSANEHEGTLAEAGRWKLWSMEWNLVPLIGGIGSIESPNWQYIYI